MQEEPTTAPIADDQAVAPTPAEEAINDALTAATGGIEGQLVENNGELHGAEPAQEETETPEDVVAAPPVTPAAEEEEEAQAAPVVETKPEADEAGVYEPPKTIDPGEFKPNDYSFDVTTNDGKVHTISTIEEAEAFAEEIDKNPENISATQFMALARKTGMMEQGLQTDRVKYDQLKEAHAAEANVAQVRDDAVNQWQSEINYLRQKGELPPISAELNTADWSDPTVAADPSVKATLDIFHYMENENKARIAAGLKPMVSALEAHTAMQLDALKQEEQQAEEQEVKTRKARGSMVGGKTPYEAPSENSGTIIGVGGSLNDIVNEFINQ